MDSESKQTPKELTDHFFRHEYAKMVAVIGHYFKTEELNLAEDIVQDTLLKALQHWEFQGIPPNPMAWLYTVAKNKTLNVLKRNQLKRKIEPGMSHFQLSESSVEELFSEQRISDDLLEMIFVACHPSLSRDSQIAFILKTLCGLSIAEIAGAFVTTHETINKRLVRARKTLKKNNVQFGIPDKDLTTRLSAVLDVIYLLFNEGYHASAGDKLIRYDLCLEAIRLAMVIRQHKKFADNSRVHALLSLMYLNSARFEARQDSAGNALEMAQQDRSRWNESLINQGLYHLDKIRNDQEISSYHILATISAHHCTASTFEQTDWQSILALYDQLLMLEDSPIVWMNRAVVLAKLGENETAIKELIRLEESGGLKNYFPIYSTFANLYLNAGLFEQAIPYFEQAILLSRQASERKVLKKKLEDCQERKKSF